jgi:hypothetical protein
MALGQRTGGGLALAAQHCESGAQAVAVGVRGLDARLELAGIEVQVGDFVGGLCLNPDYS